MIDKKTIVEKASSKAVSVLVGALIGAALALVPFYYSTSNRLDNLENQGLLYDEGLKDIQNLKVHPIKVNAKLDNIDESMKLMKDQVKLMYERQEKTYDLIIERMR